ncbi:MAG: hypothetical protein ACLPKB_11580 [Xanthobacteraceae bacterium]
MIRRLSALIAALSALTSCALSRGDELTMTMDRLVGHPVSEVAIILGPAASHANAGGGKAAFRWERYGTYQTAGVERPFGLTLMDAPPQASPSQCVIAVTATPARMHARATTLADWTVESWNATGTCH